MTTKLKKKVQKLTISAVAVVTFGVAIAIQSSDLLTISAGTDETTSLASSTIVNKTTVTVASDGAIVCDSIVQGVRDCDLADGNYTFRVTGNTGSTTQTIDYPVELINYYDDVTYTSSVSLGDSTTTKKMLVVKYHKNLTINEGVTVTATTVNGLTYKKGMYLCVMGDLVNNGTITMTARGTVNQAGENVYLWKNIDNTFEYVPAVGAAGVSNNTAGKSGTGRQTGGGAGGRVETGFGGKGGASAAGTSYSGGSGGGRNNT